MKFLKLSLLLFCVILLVSSCSLSGEGDENNTITTVGKPNSPTPAHNSIDVESAVVLSWKCDSYSSFDVYFSKSNPPTDLYIQNISTPNVTVVGLNFQTRYYWKVVSHQKDGTSVSGDVWSFVTKTNDNSAGYLLVKSNVQTKLPSFVNIMFQVLDPSGNGVDNLTTTNFDLYEDNLPVPVSESYLNIKKREETPYTLKTVLMIDNSTSVQQNLAEIKNAALSFVSSKIPQQEIAIYKFSEDAVLVQDFTNDLAKLTTAINSIGVGFYTTDLYGAVVTGAGRWTDSFSYEKIVQGTLVLLTDGTDTQGSSTLNQALAAISGKRVYTVGLGTDIDPIVLQKIGNAGFYSSGTVSELTSQFLEVQLNIQKFANSFYSLEYMSPKRGNSYHTLRLFIKDNPYNGANHYITGSFNSVGFYSIYPGLYVNTSAEYPEGIDTLKITKGENETATASTYLASKVGQYSWSLSNQSDFEMSVDSTDNSICKLFGKGAIGSQGIVTVQDIANQLIKQFIVLIK